MEGPVDDSLAPTTDLLAGCGVSGWWLREHLPTPPEDFLGREVSSTSRQDLTQEGGGGCPVAPAHSVLLLLLPHVLVVVVVCIRWTCTAPSMRC